MLVTNKGGVNIMNIGLEKKKADVQHTLTLQHNVSYAEYFTGLDKLNLCPAKYSANGEIFGSAWRHTVTMAAVSHA